MRRFTQHEELVNRGCLALSNLSLYESNHRVLVDAGVAQLLADVMAEHPKEPVVMESTSSILRRLCINGAVATPATAAVPPTGRAHTRARA